MTDTVREELKRLIFEVMDLDIDTIDNARDLVTVDEWDSFNNLMLISRAEDFFKIKFSMKDVENVNTINKIVEITKQKVSQSSS